MSRPFIVISRFIRRGVCLLAFLCASAAHAQSPAFVEVENDYADLLDAAGAISLIDSGFTPTYQGQPREHWQRIYDGKLARLDERLKRMSSIDFRAYQMMTESIEVLRKAGSLAPTGKCEDASAKDVEYTALTQALYACFDTLGNQLSFDGQKLTRLGAFDLLTRMDEPDRRKQLFYAFVPLWKAVNGANEVDSPYRRLIAMAAAKARGSDSEVHRAAQTVNASEADIEAWLVRILETWRDVSGNELIEPWDYRYVGGAAERELGPHIAREAMKPINERFYRDLGADLGKWGTLYDLDPRPGKAPLAYTDYVRRGREVNGKWRPTIARVSANYQQGGLGSLTELVHENGHVVHMMALHTRPAFMDLGDAVFHEAFADVPSWNTYEPAWQKKYLRRSASESKSLRGLYSHVMLDVAWALFEIRMLREPKADPNVLWTNITQRYLHVKPHPELAWWAVRVQLVDSPGYMVNYGLGAVLTADMRKRIDEQLGAFTTGNPQWFDWLAKNLLSSGQEKPTAVLLSEFLGRRPSPDALLDELRRIGTHKND